MKDDRFSRRGEPPTAYEVELLLLAAVDSTWLMVGRRLMASLGTDAGARALMVVLDELASEKVHVPSHEGFVEQLYRPIETAEILRLQDEEGMTAGQIGKKLGMSKQAVRQRVNRTGRRLSVRGGKCRR